MQLTRALEPMLEHVGPGASPFVVPAQCSQGLTQIARGKNSELATQSTGGASVVGDGDDGSQLVDERTQRAQVRSETVSATESHHRERSGDTVRDLAPRVAVRRPGVMVRRHSR